MGSAFPTLGYQVANHLVQNADKNVNDVNVSIPVNTSTYRRFDDDIFTTMPTS